MLVDPDKRSTDVVELFNAIEEVVGKDNNIGSMLLL